MDDVTITVDGVEHVLTSSEEYEECACNHCSLYQKCNPYLKTEGFLCWRFGGDEKSYFIEKGDVPEANDLYFRIGDIYRRIENYIKDTEHFIFYWIDDPTIRKFILENSDYESLIANVSVTEICNNTIRVRIYLLTDDTEEESSVSKWLVLNTFRDNVNANYKKHILGIDKYRLEQLKKGLEDHKKRMDEIEREIKTLRQKVDASAKK